MYSSMENMNLNPETMNSLARDCQATEHPFKVESFSWLVKAEIEKYISGVFESGGYKWKLILYPNGNEEAKAEENISLYLSIEGTEPWPLGWELRVNVKLLVYDHFKKKYITIKDCGEPVKRFNELEKEWGLSKIFDLKTFMDESNGFLLNDCCLFNAEVSHEQDQSAEENRTKCFPIRGYNIQNGTLRMVRELAPAHFLFPIKSFSAIEKQNGESHESNIFVTGGFKWRLSLYPNGNEKAKVKDHISLYLRIQETNTLDPNWEVHATLKFFVYDYINKNYVTVEDLDGTTRRFDKLKEEWGLDRLIPLNDFKYISNGFLLDDSSCKFGIEVFVVKHQGKIPKLPPVVPGTQVHTWIVNDYSSIASAGIANARDSEKFSMGGTNWYLRLFPGRTRTGKTEMISSLYLFIDSSAPTFKWDVSYTLRIVNQINDNHYEMSDNYTFTPSKYGPKFTGSGFADFLESEKLDNPSSGFIQNNTAIVQVIFNSIIGG